MNTILRKNNIFRYATSELSQDAFICWLLSYATKECWNENSSIRECAISFIAKILEHYSLDSKENIYVKNIVKQYKNIDVLFQVDKYHVIIEDKTFTDSHDDQVNRYKRTLISEGVKEENIICVYYKIEDQPLPEKDVDIEFTRESILSIFEPYKKVISNEIFVDYVEYLEWLEWETRAYERLPIIEWTRSAYIGFFKHLSNTILKDEKVSWGYVANPTGGFMGLWWSDILTDSDYSKLGFTKEYLSELYLQIEDNIIAVKYTIQKQESTDMNKVKDIRWKLYEYFYSQIGTAFKRKVFKSGAFMTVGYIEYSEKDYQEKLGLMRSLLQDWPMKF